MDSQTTIVELRQLVQRFVDQRDWHSYHNPKNLSMSLAIEAAELMEHFQWIDGETSLQLRQDPDSLRQAGEELADVICYALAMANALQIDVSDTVRAKMKKNEVKYPAPPPK